MKSIFCFIKKKILYSFFKKNIINLDVICKDYFLEVIILIKKLSFSIFLVLILIFSAASIQAADVNVTDVDAVNTNGDVVLQLDESIQAEEIADSDLDSNLDLLQENIRNQTQLTSPTTSIYHNGNYQVTLIDSNTNDKLANKNITFSINDINYFATTDSKGVATLNLKFNPGSYLVTSYFAGDDEYGASDNLSCWLKILPTVKSSDVTKYYLGSNNYAAKFLDSQGRPLKYTAVKITVNNKKFIQKTNKKGIVVIPMKYKPGTYKIVAKNPVTGYKLQTSFKILSTVSSSNLKKVKGDSKYFVAKFLKSNGKPLANKYVKVTINGKAYNLKTNSKGKLKLSFNNFNKGTYKVICYNKDGLSQKSYVDVYNIAYTKLSVGLYTFLENEAKKEVKIKFSTTLDDDSKANQKIEINIDGETYYRYTDSNGLIWFKLPYLDAYVHDIECYYYGNRFFSESYASNYVTILDTSNTELSIDEEESLSFGNFAGTPLNVALTAGDVPLVKRTVCFTINNQNYNVTTDYDGIASLPIKLDVGNYTVYYKSFADSRVKASSGSCNITVFKRTDTKIDCTFLSSYGDYEQTFKFFLRDSNGNPMKYEDVVLTVNGETYEETTTSKGYVAIQTYLPIGKYKVAIKYAGNNEYASSYTSAKITVVLSKYARGINEKASSASNDYLKPTQNCQVNNAKIKSLVKSLTKGLTTEIDKARAIFHYVRDNVVYDYYSGTHKGALGTLKSKSANCVDHSHLLVAMFRTAGLKARYVQGVCTYSDGTFGHVWTQVYLGNVWICADAVGSGNELGQINDWNTKSFKYIGNYVGLSF